MAATPITEDYAIFKHPSLPKDKEVKTWYRVYGDLSNGKRPLVTLHGGPGATHLYLTVPFEEYANRTGHAVIFYDQVGCGKSTHLREKLLDEEFWVPDLFVAELDNLLDHLGIRSDFDLYGQSWGGMLIGKYAASESGKTSGLHKAVLGSGPASIPLYTEAGHRLLAAMPKDIRDTVEKYSREGKYDAPEYLEALMVVYRKHMCRLEVWPDILTKSFEELEKDNTVYLTMTGPDEFNAIGNLRGRFCADIPLSTFPDPERTLTSRADFDMTEECKQIKVPCLLINGEYDTCQDSVNKPWFAGIDKVKWITLEGRAHCAHLEDPNKYLQIVTEFLSDDL